MIHQFAKIKDRLRKKGTPLSGGRRTECNHNPIVETFNPHFHVLVEGRAVAIALVEHWLSLVPGTVSDAQDIQVADNDTLMELFKYISKQVVSSQFDAKAQDTINRAFVGVRAFQPFGKVKKSSVTVATVADDDELVVEHNNSVQGEYRIISSYYWNPFLRNWQNSDGVVLSKTTIRAKVEKLLSKVEYG
jgi:hypothetical protein